MSASASPAVFRLRFSVFGHGAAANGFNENVRSNAADRAFRRRRRRRRGCGYRVIYYYIKTLSHLYRVYGRRQRISPFGFPRKRLLKIYRRPSWFETGDRECTAPGLRK